MTNIVQQLVLNHIDSVIKRLQNSGPIDTNTINDAVGYLTAFRKQLEERLTKD